MRDTGDSRSGAQDSGPHASGTQDTGTQESGTQDTGTQGEHAPRSVVQRGDPPPRGAPPPVLIAVDAMGGDNAPAEIVAGAVAAARSGGPRIVLTGRPACCARCLPSTEPSTKCGSSAPRKPSA